MSIVQHVFLRQSLLAEYASLKYACPDGVYIAVVPGDPTRWTGIIFVREGPYSPAILRFQILFIEDYPTSPPLITFSTDIFHPLVNPLTTYTYTSSTSEGDTASIADQDRLPPGGFSLRHGFPYWFSPERGSRSLSNHPSRASSISGGPSVPATTNNPSMAKSPEVPVLGILEYMKSAFTDEKIMDSIPLDAAANQGAYHAWKSHRTHEAEDDNQQKAGGASALKSRLPGEWNWEGVWEERVKKGIRASQSEGILFGGAGSNDDLIRFSDISDEAMGNVRRMILEQSGRQEQATGVLS